ncbi:MAG: hypothetical protein ACK4M9_10625 [Anaerobacillus sp.]|uniref:hypothetical protein n=1 Tax=Anaerobacillus sp. TaxID=1872506 RepID=UPI00391D0113
MKKLIIPILLLISVYSVYYDLSMGTLPTKTIAAAQINDSNPEPTVTISYELITVEAGYTVLSIVEELHNEPVNASIQQIIVDFETLNPGTKANNIQIGKAYLIPTYYK